MVCYNYVAFFSDGEDLNTVDLNNINLDDDNFDEGDPNNIVIARLSAWCNSVKQCKASKKKIYKEPISARLVYNKR